MLVPSCGRFVCVCPLNCSTALHNLSLAAAGGSAAATRALEQAQDADYEAQNLEIHQVPDWDNLFLHRVSCRVFDIYFVFIHASFSLCFVS